MTTVREDLYEAVQAAAAKEDDIEGAVLTGFMVIAEWQGSEGGRWISKVSGDHASGLPSWRERGLAAEVLLDWWTANDDEKEPEGSE